MNKKILNITLLLLFSCCWSIIVSQEQLTNLPTVYITTDNGNPVVDKEVYLKGKITIKSSVIGENISDVVTEIRGRGNSTWNKPKKPYRLKLDKKANLFGLPAKEKSWVLLANYADKTLMRNALAFKVSETVGLEFTPAVKFIDLVLNNTYQGNYMLTDQVEVADFRVPVEKQEITDITEPLITGGYLLEIDGFASSEPKWFTTPEGLKVTVKYPKDDEINNEQMAYITNFTRDFENALFSSNFKDPDKGYRPLVDSVSLVNWYIGCELTGNSDSFWSTYIYKKRSENKFFFGPMWDYDIAFNNDHRLGNAVNKLMRDVAHQPRTWIQRLWQDEWFQRAVERRWKELIAQGLEDQLLTYVSDTETLLQSSQQKNFAKWTNLNTRVYLELYVFPTYRQGVDYLKTYITDRIEFLSQSFITVEPEKPTEPFVADNFYYRILNKRTNNAIDVTDESLEANAALMMWEPNSDDDGQLWKIESIGGDLFRFVNKQSNMVMTADGRDRNLIQKPFDSNDTNQKWQIVPLFTGGLYGIVNPTSGFSVNNSGGRFNNGNPVIMYDNNIYLEEKVNQHWYMNKDEEISSEVSRVNYQTFSCYTNNQTIYYSNLPDNSTVVLYNQQGIPVYSMTDISGSGQLKVNHQGIYILSVITKNEVCNYKIIL